MAKVGDASATESLNEDGVYLYPNPNNGIINIDFYGVKYDSMKIFNSVGTPVYSKQLNGESSLTIDLSTVLKTGIYMISLQSDSSVSTKKLIV